MQQKDEFGTEMAKLLGGLSNAKSVSVSGLVLEVVAQDTWVLLTPFSGLRHLYTRTWLSRNSIKATHCLLSNSHKVETLFVGIIKAEIASTVEGPEYLCDRNFHHLRLFKIKNIQRLEEEYEFIEGILKSAICLEELIVVKHKDTQPGSEKRLVDMRADSTSTFQNFST